MIDPPCLRGRARYERIVEGRVDDEGEADALAHTVQLADDDGAVEVSVVVTASPSYEIRAASGRGLRGDMDAAVLASLRSLAGTAMVSGLTRRVREATGGGPGAALLVDAIVEVARLARQVAKLPRERAEAAAAAGPRGCWELDTTAWADLPDSCFTYSAAGRALLTRAVTTSNYADLYSPRPRQRDVFGRRKVARLERDGARLRLFHAMHDNVHGFEIAYEVDLPSGRIVAAESQTPRLPYRDICSEPQGRIRALVGETLDAGLARRMQTVIGGSGGCAQLYDLTADLLKLAGPAR